MYFPKHWARATLEGPNRENEPTSVDAWGWSDLSEDDARQKALARAQSVLARLPSPKGPRASYYAEGNRPLREPILEDVSQGGIRAVISRNSLGCEVLNADGLAFADLDYTPARIPFFQQLFDFGGKQALARRAAWEAQAIVDLKAWQASNSSWAFRLYRTAGGLRILVTSRSLQAGTPEAIAWLQAIGGDPLYHQLCLTQKSFRARLTPKPWRCGETKPDVRFPYETTQARQTMEKWLHTYRTKSAPFAVCRFLEAVGSTLPRPELKPFVDLHDDRTSALSNKPLA